MYICRKMTKWMKENMMKKEDMSVETANREFWLRMTKECSIPYCAEMLKLSVEYCRANPAVSLSAGKGCEKSVRKDDCAMSPAGWISEETVGRICGYMDMMVERTCRGRRGDISPGDSPFPSDLLGFIHGYCGDSGFEPAHLMCKLGALRDEARGVTYEFLIEYDIFHPDVEIYYGVKAVSDSWVTTSEFQFRVLEDWRKVRSAKKYIGLANQMKMTNNGENGTFWPFWLRLNIDGHTMLGEAVKRLERFYNDYSRNLQLPEAMPPRFGEVYDNLLALTHSPESLDRLLDEIERRCGAYGRRLFMDVFVSNCLDKGYIERCGESVYCLKGIPNYKFAYLARLFFIGLSYKIGEGRIPVPQKELTNVFLGRRKTHLSSSDWGKSDSDMKEEWGKCEQEVIGWLNLPVQKL